MHALRDEVISSTARLILSVRVRGDERWRRRDPETWGELKHSRAVGRQRHTYPAALQGIDQIHRGSERERERDRETERENGTDRRKARRKV